MWEVTAHRVTTNGEFEMPTAYLSARVYDIRNNRDARTAASHLFGPDVRFEVRAIGVDS
ncbi:hypothetical protein GCM10017772_03790 [Promicromonospora soli]|uniref:Uncharacterized protein n=1 Tax=Promicromonospora soli TaxID=2035533 RepID=A0A919KNC7_9MICO|nr:hypothetical protein GCM10017772_03790 [Promicromonospora soli]